MYKYLSLYCGEADDILGFDAMSVDASVSDKHTVSVFRAEDFFLHTLM